MSEKSHGGGAISWSWLAGTVLSGMSRIVCSQPVSRAAESVSDEELLACLQRGERGALDLLIGRHADAVFSCLRRRIRVRETAEDLFQETWIRVVERCDTYRANHPVRPWLYRIALNVLTDHLRREGAVRRGGGAEHLPLEEAAPTVAAPAASGAAETEERTSLHQAVERLPEPFREVVRLRYFEELSTAEVGEVLGCAEGTVKSRLSRGLALLQAEMEKIS